MSKAVTILNISRNDCHVCALRNWSILYSIDFSFFIAFGVWNCRAIFARRRFKSVHDVMLCNEKKESTLVSRIVYIIYIKKVYLKPSTNPVMTYTWCICMYIFSELDFMLCETFIIWHTWENWMFHWSALTVGLFFVDDNLITVHYIRVVFLCAFFFYFLFSLPPFL